MKKALLILLAFVLTLPVMAQNEGAKFRKIDSLLNYYYANKKFMGAVSIREKNQVVFEKAYGFADVANKMPAANDTKYKIGSITEMFTSAIVFQLVEEKKLTLQTKLTEFFPKIKNADKITIGAMLNHKSGIYDLANDASYGQFKTKLQTRKDILDRLYNLEPTLVPDSLAQVSSSNYLLLGYIIQDITKKTFKENVTTRIIKPAGLTHTQYFNKINTKKNEALSYAFADGHWEKETEIHETIVGASGSLQSTPGDLTKFIKALYDGKLIKPESLAEMTKIDNGIGKGVFNFMFAERKFTGRNGSIEGFRSVVGYYPKEQLGFSLMLNGENTNFNDLVLGILSCYYKLPYRFPDFTNVNVSDDILKSYEGYYTNKNLPFKIEIKVVDGRLRVHADEQGTFYLVPKSTTEFRHDASGVVMIFSPTAFTLKQNGTSTLFAKQ
jgi:CubicO group peptidase (beta-lactamase class C family)